MRWECMVSEKGLPITCRSDWIRVAGSYYCVKLKWIVGAGLEYYWLHTGGVEYH